MKKAAASLWFAAASLPLLLLLLLLPGGARATPERWAARAGQRCGAHPTVWDAPFGAHGPPVFDP